MCERNRRIERKTKREGVSVRGIDRERERGT